MPHTVKKGKKRKNLYIHKTFRRVSSVSTVRTYSGYVCIIPGVVVHKNCSVCHGTHLVAVVPPGKNLRIWCMKGEGEWKT